MSVITFPITTLVALQGDRALALDQHSKDWVRYRVIGFKKPYITIIDHRKSGVDALLSILKTSVKTQFAPLFNTLADISIHWDENQNLEITLKEPSQRFANFVLWIAIGLEGYLPVYPYEFCHINAISKDEFSVVALYQGTPEYQPQPFSE